MEEIKDEQQPESSNCSNVSGEESGKKLGPSAQAVRSSTRNRKPSHWVTDFTT
ncbi:hypothetical protein ZOSMA_272G00010 [Zostera marina]|uniref:Uncharacterized protein n=1 Tax=Zostera marina TaxID=29655 RepID=A0A0K9PE14_ZOSMR|nr:hypothetical protein ZOSMA_272G00010 [Zostera marina]